MFLDTTSVTASEQSLRDHIALIAMEATLKSEQIVPLSSQEKEWLASGVDVPTSRAKAYDRWSGQEAKLAQFCYRLADAMLAASGNKG